MISIQGRHIGKIAGGAWEHSGGGFKKDVLRSGRNTRNSVCTYKEIKYNLQNLLCCVLYTKNEQTSYIKNFKE